MGQLLACFTEAGEDTTAKQKGATLPKGTQPVGEKAAAPPLPAPAPVPATTAALTAAAQDLEEAGTLAQVRSGLLTIPKSSSGDKLTAISKSKSGDRLNLLVAPTSSSLTPVPETGGTRWSPQSASHGLTPAIDAARASLTGALLKEAKSGSGAGSSSGPVGSSHGLVGSSHGLVGSSHGLVGSSHGVTGSTQGKDSQMESFMFGKPKLQNEKRERRKKKKGLRPQATNSLSSSQSQGPSHSDTGNMTGTSATASAAMLAPGSTCRSGSNLQPDSASCDVVNEGLLADETTPGNMPDALDSSEGSHGSPHSPNSSSGQITIMDPPPGSDVENVLSLICNIFQLPVALVAAFRSSNIFIKSSADRHIDDDEWRYSLAQWSLSCATLDDVLIVQDASTDETHKSTYCVIYEPAVKFFMAAPLKSSTGEMLGTLCMVDFKSRNMDMSNLMVINNLSTMVNRQLERDMALAEERNQNAAAAKQMQVDLMRALDHYEKCVMYVDTSIAGWSVLYTNLAWERITGAPREHVTGRALQDVFQACGDNTLDWEEYNNKLEGGDEFVVHKAALKQKPDKILRLKMRLASKEGAVEGILPAGLPEFIHARGNEAHNYFIIIEEHDTGSQSGVDSTYEALTKHVEKVPGLDLHHILGKGGFGSVYFGTWQGQPVAVKMIDNRLCKTNTEGISLEALMGQELDHPNIVKTIKYVMRNPARGGSQSHSQHSTSIGNDSLGDSSRHRTTSAHKATPLMTSAQMAAAADLTSASDMRVAPFAPIDKSPRRPVYHKQSSHLHRIEDGDSDAASTSTSGTHMGPASAGDDSNPQHRPAVIPMINDPKPDMVVMPSMMASSSDASTVCGPASMGEGSTGGTGDGSGRDPQASRLIRSMAAAYGPPPAPSSGAAGMFGPVSRHQPHSGFSFVRSGEEVLVRSNNSNSIASDNSNEDAGEIWLIMEFCDRGTLQDALDNGALKQPKAGGAGGTETNLMWMLTTAVEVASAVSYLHERGIVHGDLTAWNVMLSSCDGGDAGRDFRAKVADFGLSRSMDVRSKIKTRTYGTITHMPPETLISGIISKAADVFSFGVLLWQMYTGMKPWAGMNHGQIIYNVGMKNVQLLFPAGTPEAIQQLSSNCTVTDPSKRPTFAAIAASLSEIRSTL